ncbi:hypothetical protein BBI17_001492 [Phytophthora kernoviae]|uniref:Uncharacterized protein n=2 Tax=Phytophthora kernoviae TaxID=325452 RepID=A0A421FBF4_9STRA|nr:hypothetical protein G195_002262 [Phytophthora kernoviae 00238/432]KAG2530947.1 hypothetical protein JM16_001394 [Phytophthora kernoviae]KAG2531988.1 hypothetical protein JM18_001476 [Phytophthora kernoviae]RLN36725.1 hypothetical protein BBI17_001492 [Phytophthora kernoviae]
MTTDGKRELPPSSTTSGFSASTDNNTPPHEKFQPLQQYISAKEVAQHQVFRQHDMRRSISSTQFNGGCESTSSPALQSKVSAGGSSVSASNSPRCLSPASSPMAESILKVVLIGDSGVGKSNLVMRFTKNKYMPHSVQTVGFEFATKTIRVGDRRLKAQIWDTAGQESSFEHVTGWLAQVHEHSHHSLVLILVGNKCDLAHLPESREVSTLEAARFAAKHSMEFLEASALDSTNVVDAFKKLIVPVGRLLSPTDPKKIARLPTGWRRVLSRTRPGEYSYENQYTKERISFAPKEPAKPSQQSFRASASGLKSDSPSVVTVTRESLQRQHQKAYLAQNQTPQCGACISDCTIL